MLAVIGITRPSAASDSLFPIICETRSYVLEGVMEPVKCILCLFSVVGGTE